MSADGPMLRKYHVERVDGAEADPASKHYGGCRLFVLDIDHDPAARVALSAYAVSIEATHPVLAADCRRMVIDAGLRWWVDRSQA